MGWLKAWRERREVRRVFAKYLNPELVDRLSKNDASLHTQLKPATIPFILLQVRDDQLAQVAPRLAIAFDIVIAKYGVICDVMSSITVSTFGFPVSAGAAQDRTNQAACVTELMRGLAPDVRLVHGIADGLFGNSGSRNLFRYGPIIPNFANVLEELMKLEFGETRELSS